MTLRRRFIWLVVLISLFNPVLLSTAETPQTRDEKNYFDIKYWRTQLIAKRYRNRGPVLLKMLALAAQDPKGERQTFLQRQGPTLFFPLSKMKDSYFRKLLLTLFRFNDLASLNTHLKYIETNKREPLIAEIFETIFYFCGSDKTFIFNLRTEFRKCLKWPWNFRQNREKIQKLIDLIDDHLGAEVRYHLRVTIQNLKPIGKTKKMELSTTWELIERKNLFNRKLINTEPSKKIIAKRNGKSIVSNEINLTGIAGFQTKKPLSFDDVDRAIIFLDSVSKGHNPAASAPSTISPSNWEAFKGKPFEHDDLFKLSEGFSPLMHSELHSSPIPATFKVIKRGTFTMGSPKKERGRQNDETQHRVTIPYDFEMQATEVTQAQWFKFMKTNPSTQGTKPFCRKKHTVANNGTSLCPNHPIEDISWNDAQVFIRKINTSAQDGYTYRLPLEVEWEYAARAGSTTAFSFGDSPTLLKKYAWYKNNENGTTHAVATRTSNDFGLYDMHGNVDEWMQDRYVSDYEAYHRYNLVVSYGQHRVVRGGHRSSKPRACRSADRHAYAPDYHYRLTGFRLVRVKKKP